MKLVKIGKSYINPEAIDEIEGNDKETFIGMRSNNSLNVSLPIEKVLQAIEGSPEHKVSSNYKFENGNLILQNPKDDTARKVMSFTEVEAIYFLMSNVNK